MCGFHGVLTKSSAEIQLHDNDVFEANSKKIAFNGKIYNAQALKKKLEENNHQFKTNSDSELILNVYEEYGEDFMNYLHGTFAIAIWDVRNKELVMVRDRVGKKPYYYYNGLDQLLFGSELKKIIARNEQEINYEAVENFLRFYYIPQPMTIFQNVYQVMPGHSIKYSLENDTLTIKKYWDINPDATEVDGPYQSMQQRVRETLTSSVRERMESGESASAFLSGGIDSSIVVGLMAEQSTRPVNTFTIGYKNLKQYDESALAKTVSKLHHTNHHELFIEFDDLHEVIETIIGNMEEPFADSSAIPTYYVSRLTKQHTSVALSGDGGDELFAGYNKYTSVYYQQLYSKLPKMIREKLIEAPLQLIPEDKRNPITAFATKAKKFTRSANTETFQMHVKLMESYGQDEISRLVKHKSFNKFNVDEQLSDYFFYLNTNESVNRMMYTDFKFALPNDMLVKTDRMSKINGLEIRSPFLDHKVVELAYEIPLKYKMRRANGKIILKETFSDLLPDKILTAKKRGFEIPLAEWFKTELKELVVSSLTKEKVEKANLVHFPAVQTIIEEHMKSKKNHANLIWSLIVLHKWHENFLRNVEGGKK
ncbi:asparagine synthase (glutamine-hydrolyzing) [Sporosarcina sp. Marseille-Q4943]|uniref:asparagine synthase (glutamine-hydrolyzing) n=1 Tax=Sporosarcina sp. Marseille-Q4943 TaxID=2942204 RepID=UPI00208DCC03|nr:asparagine synthase (glutamine-hydrolyzing) [Sporosarcina sp. Marseille-Q4943]